MNDQQNEDTPETDFDLDAEDEKLLEDFSVLTAVEYGYGD